MSHPPRKLSASPSRSFPSESSVFSTSSFTKVILHCKNLQLIREHKINQRAIMKSVGRCLLIFPVVILWSTVLALQRPPPRYSQQYMPETAFTCRNKIVGSYYADPETDCQVFHVCVSVAGSVQDYKFLCPNDTAFDQESQTCADWYDVDCEAATLYYASDNFDLYRIGSGLESPHYDAIRTDDEPQDNLQRSESNDPVRSSANALNRVSSPTYNNNKPAQRSNSNTGFYNHRTNKEDTYNNEGTYKEETVPTEKKKTGIRKVSRKQTFSGSTNDYPVSTTAVSSTYNNQNNYNGNFFNNNNNNNNNNGYNQWSTTVGSSSTVRPQENYSRNTQKYTVTASSTYRPNANYQDSYSSYQPQSQSSTVRTTAYNANNNYNQDNTGSYTPSTTLRTTNYNGNNNRNGYQPYVGQYTQSSTVLPSTNYQASDYTNYQKNYNVQHSNGNNGGYRQSTTAATTVYDNNYGSASEQYRNEYGSTGSEISQTTSKYFTNYASNSYAPTTYSPPTKKFVLNDNSQAQSVARGGDRYNSQLTDDGQYYNKNDQTIKPSTQHYDNTKASKKVTQYNNYESTNGGKYYTETSTDNYDFGRVSVGIGFSPASINHLAETPRSTTPVPKRQASATTYNPSNFSGNTQKSASINTTPRSSTYVSGSARPFTSTTRFASSTTARPKSGKKNDYDYAYYDNPGSVDYDGLEIERVAGTKESSKLARN